MLVKSKYILLAFVTFFSFSCLERGATKDPGQIDHDPSREQGELQFLEFKPIGVRPSGGLVDAPNLVNDSVFINNLTLVMSYYGIPSYRKFGVEKQSVWAPAQIIRDREYSMNLTRKALDNSWLRTHVGPCSY